MAMLASPDLDFACFTRSERDAPRAVGWAKRNVPTPLELSAKTVGTARSAPPLLRGQALPTAPSGTEKGPHGLRAERGATRVSGGGALVRARAHDAVCARVGRARGLSPRYAAQGGGARV